MKTARDVQDHSICQQTSSSLPSDMQRSGSVPSAHKPPRPPNRDRVSSQMETPQRIDIVKDVERGDRDQCRMRAEQAIHIIPVVLLACLLILYICSSAPFQGYEMLGSNARRMAGEKVVVSERHLQQTNTLQVEEENLIAQENKKAPMDLRHHPSDLPRQPFMLRGVVN